MMNNYVQSSFKMHGSLQDPCSDHQEASAFCWPRFMAIVCEFVAVVVGTSWLQLRKTLLWTKIGSRRPCTQWSILQKYLTPVIWLDACLDTHLLWRIKRKMKSLDIYDCCHLNNLASISESVIRQEQEHTKRSDNGSVCHSTQIILLRIMNSVQSRNGLSCY